MICARFIGNAFVAGREGGVMFVDGGSTRRNTMVTGSVSAVSRYKWCPKPDCRAEPDDVIFRGE